MPHDPARILTAIAELRTIINTQQLDCMIELLGGEESDWFRDIIMLYAHRLRTMPKTYEQQDAKDPTVYLHYFNGGSDWWITERDMERPQFQAFGLASINGEDPELGYISIVELIRHGVELDLHFDPRPLSEVRSAA